MRRLGFWSNSEGQQIRAINEAAHELDSLHHQVSTLRHALRAREVEIVQLKSAMQAICDLLVDLDLIEEEALAYRIDAALTDSARPVVAAPLDRSESVCSRCQQQVPAAEISFTDRGPTCDACIAAFAGQGDDD